MPEAGTSYWNLRRGRGGPPVLADGASSTWGNRALSVEDGEERWRTSTPETVVDGDMVLSGVTARPAVADGAVYAYAFDGLYEFALE